MGFDPGFVQYGLGISFLGGALLITNRLADERLDIFGQAGAFLENEGGRNGEQLIGEIDDLFARGCHGHGGDHAVEFVGFQAGNHAVKITLDPFALHFQFSTNRIA
ncbi:hypothetical protein D3C75_1145860 [compost metagenome]